MFRNLLKPDSPLMITMTRITDVMFLSLFWLLCCAPLVTVGASCAALYDASFRTFRKNEKNAWQRFLAVFRGNLKGGLVPSILFLAVFAGLLKAVIVLWNQAVTGGISWMLFAAGVFLLIVVLGILNILFPVMSRFENRFGALIKNTVLLALANLPRTIAVGMLNAVAIFICVRLVIPLFVMPVLTALISSLFIEPMFAPYMNDDENAAV